MLPASPKTRRVRLLALSCALFALLAFGAILSTNNHDNSTTPDAVIVADKEAAPAHAATAISEPTASVASLNESSDQSKSSTRSTATEPGGAESAGAQAQARSSNEVERGVQSEESQSEESEEREREASGALEALAQRALQMQDEFGQIPENALVRAFEEKRQMTVDPRVWPNEGKEPMPLTAGIQPSGWVTVGPGNIGGRTRTIAIDPTNPDTIYLGGASGGVWKTTNAGATWRALNDFMANLAVTSIVIDPANASVLYAATGEGFGTSPVRGAGIFKSTDAGATWAQLASTANTNFHFVNRLAIDPNNSQVLLAVTARSTSTPTNQSGANGIWRTENGGTTWERVNSAAAIYDVDFHPTDSQKALASGEGRILYSNDNGRTWTEATGIPQSVKRIEIAYARSQPQKVFASVSNLDKGSGQIYGSEDGGASFTRRDTQDYKFLGDQGDYDNALWVDPVDPSILIVGGVDLFRSSDGGATLTKISSWQNAQQFGTSAHADHHVIVAHPQYNGTTNRTVFFGNDGGIYKTVDVFAAREDSGWTVLNKQLAITQFYGAAGHAASGRIVGGTQDNGTIRYAGNTETWSEVNGGDGGYAAYDPVDINYFYGEYTNLTIARATTSDGKMTDIYNGITDANNGERANFIAPFILDPNNSNRMLAGGRSLWRSNDVKAATPAWTSIKSPSATNQNISAIAVKPGNPDVIWIGHNDGQVFYTTNGTNDAPTWTPVAGLPERYITRITLGNAGDNRIYVTTGGFTNDNIQRSTDNGATWTNVQNNMPQIPVRSLVINPTNPEWLYVGTEIGVFASVDGGANWSPTNEGPSNVAVDELFWMGDKLGAATHGRGIFLIATTTVAPATIQFAQNATTVDEQSGLQANIQVTRTGGDLLQPVRVQFTTNDDQRLFNCNPATEGQPNGAIRGVATARCDYSSTVSTLTFAANETSKTVSVPITDDAHSEGAETFSVSLREPVGAALGMATNTVTILDNDTAEQPNPIANNTFFVRQHYLDFFGRNPSPNEITTWTNVIAPDCGLDAPDACYDRIWVSGKGFFESQEFQQKGYFVYRFYKTLGASRLPTYNEFIPDMVSLLGTGDADKSQFAQRFMARTDYAAIYNNLSNTEFVDMIVQRTGLTSLNAAQMKADLNNNAKTRQQLLVDAVESAEMKAREFTESWVVMQYFGYLRRDGAASEYKGWVDYLAANPTKWRQMINGFANSIEYRQRFGTP